jgi:hypothetical protein
LFKYKNIEILSRKQFVMPIVSKGVIAAGTVKAANAVFFTNDIVPTSGPGGNDPTKFRLTVSVTAAVVIDVSIDGQVTWNHANQNATLVANSIYMFDFHVRAGDAVNFRIPTLGGATLNVCRVDELDNEG